MKSNHNNLLHSKYAKYSCQYLHKYDNIYIYILKKKKKKFSIRGAVN